ncbi:MAG TPA: hypothetical protein VFR05_11050, partial [Terriglobia bacterium]|nr:hypothetical protein [Terriglobia bacterium]
MKLAVGLIDGLESVDVELLGEFTDAAGRSYSPGRYTFNTELALDPVESSASFAIDDIVIGVGFHWERKERQVFRGDLRLVQRNGLTAINGISLEEYVTS